MRKLRHREGIGLPFAYPASILPWEGGTYLQESRNTFFRAWQKWKLSVPALGTVRAPATGKGHKRHSVSTETPLGRDLSPLALPLIINSIECVPYKANCVGEPGGRGDMGIAVTCQLLPTTGSPPEVTGTEGHCPAHTCQAPAPC